MNVIYLICRCSVALIFIVAAVSKGLDLVRFGRQVEALGWGFGLAENTIVHYLAHILAGLVVIVEFGLGVALLNFKGRRYIILSAIGLFLVFGLVNFFSAYFSRTEECGCFGMFWHRSPKVALLENLVFLGLAIVSLRDRLDLPLRLKHIARFACLVLILLVIINVFHPFVSNLSLQKGVRFFIGEDGETLTNLQNRALWFFDPECDLCLKQLETYIIPLASLAPNRLIGFTKATTGRVDEFFWDFSPNFPITIVKAQDWRVWGVPVGSLVIVRNNKIKRVWRTFEIPQHIDDIKLELKR